MPTLQQAINALKEFKKVRPDIQEIRGRLKEITPNQPVGVDAIRCVLMKILSETGLCEESLKKAVHYTLLALAQYKPINENDPTSLCPIALENRVCISTGHQFDIVTLMTFHKLRAPRASDGDYKTIINPLTNRPVSSRDAEYIAHKADKKNIPHKIPVSPATVYSNAARVTTFRPEQAVESNYLELLVRAFAYMPYY